MSQESQGTDSAAPASLPVKRKRGHPRKNDSVSHVEKASVTPGSDGVKRNQHRKVDPTDGADNVMVGQVVSGVLEGSFDAGHMLAVRVGNTNTVLRGFVFGPGLSVPISAANDVAPHIEMVKRNEIRLPLVDPLIKVHCSSPQCEQKNEPLVYQVPRVAHKVLPSKLQTSHPVPLKSMPNDAIHAPQAAPPTLLHAEIKSVSSSCIPSEKLAGDISLQVSSQAAESQIEKRKSTNKMPKKETDLFSEEVGNTNQPLLFMSQQAVQSEIKNQPISITKPLEHNKTVKPAEVLQENEASTLTKGPSNEVAASKDSELEPKSVLSFKISQCNGTNDQVPQVQSQAMGSELEHEELLDDAFTGANPDLKLNYTLITAASPSVATEPISEPVKKLQENQASSKCDISPGIQSELSLEVKRRDETSHSNIRLLSDATKRSREIKKEVR